MTALSMGQRRGSVIVLRCGLVMGLTISFAMCPRKGGYAAKSIPGATPGGRARWAGHPIIGDIRQGIDSACQSGVPPP